MLVGVSESEKSGATPSNQHADGPPFRVELSNLRRMCSTKKCCYVRTVTHSQCVMLLLSSVEQQQR